MTIEDFEKSYQGVKRKKKIKIYLMGWGTQGMRENLIPINTSSVNGPYIQDKLLFNETLSGTSYSSVTTNMLTESTF